MKESRHMLWVIVTFSFIFLIIFNRISHLNKLPDKTFYMSILCGHAFCIVVRELIRLLNRWFCGQNGTILVNICGFHVWFLLIFCLHSVTNLKIEILQCYVCTHKWCRELALKYVDVIAILANLEIIQLSYARWYQKHFTWYICFAIRHLSQRAKIANEVVHKTSHDVGLTASHRAFKFGNTNETWLISEKLRPSVLPTLTIDF